MKAMTAPARPARRPAPKPAPRAKKPNHRPILIGLGAVIALAAVIAVVAGSGGTATTIAQTRPVSVKGATLPALPDTGKDPAVGLAAPEATGESFTSAPVSITKDGTPRVLVFVAHWCPQCQKEVPLLSQHFAQAGLPGGVTVVAISTGVSPERPNYPPSEWLAREQWPASILVDDGNGTVADAYGLQGFPYFVAVNGAGKVVARASGEISMTQFDQLVAAARA